MKQSIEASLAVVQLGITLVGAVAAATGGAGAEETIEPVLLGWGMPPGAAQFLAIALIVAPLTVITIILGELVPKVFALRNKEWVCLTLSTPMEWFSYAVWPAVWFFELVVTWIVKLGQRARKPAAGAHDADSSIQDLHGAAALARMTRLIGHREEGIIVSASRLASTPVRRIMLPAEYIDMLPADDTLAEALVGAHLGMHTRYPVTEAAGNPQQIIGYVNFKDIVASLRLAPQAPSFRNLVRRLNGFDADASVSDCLERLIRERNHIGLVREAGGKVVGMITLEDVIEELVGEIHDEFDRLPSHLSPAGKGWIAGGFLTLSDLRATTGIDLQPLTEKPTHTLNDWIVERLGRPPRGGDVVTADTCRVDVRKTRGVLVQEAFVNRMEAVETSQ
jgi:putative hemolysin